VVLPGGGEGAHGVVQLLKLRNFDMGVDVDIAEISNSRVAQDPRELVRHVLKAEERQ
jgi:hypothetical protein